MLSKPATRNSKSGGSEAKSLEACAVEPQTSCMIAIHTTLSSHPHGDTENNDGSWYRVVQNKHEFFGRNSVINSRMCNPVDHSKIALRLQPPYTCHPVMLQTRHNHNGQGKRAKSDGSSNKRRVGRAVTYHLQVLDPKKYFRSNHQSDAAEDQPRIRLEFGTVGGVGDRHWPNDAKQKNLPHTPLWTTPATILRVVPHVGAMLMRVRLKSLWLAVARCWLHLCNVHDNFQITERL